MRSVSSWSLSCALSAAVLAADAADAADAGLSPEGRTWQAATCIALLAALGLAGWRLSAVLLDGEEIATRATGAFALALAWGVGSATALGALGLLTPGRFELLAALGAVLCLLPRRKTVSGVSEAGAAVEIRLLLPISLLAALTLAILADQLYCPPGAFSYDDSSYHLSAVATWLHSHDLRMIKFAFGDPGTTFYPIGSELWTWILVAPFRDSDVLARWSQLPFALFTLVAIVAVARRLDLSWSSVLLAVVCYWSVPRVLPLALTAGNDCSLAFWTVAGVDAALLFARRADGRRAAYAGVLLGLLLGTKYIAVLFAPLLLAVWWAAWSEEPGAVSFRRFRRAAGLAALVLAAAFLAGGYTYLRTAAVTGNPLFPSPVTLFSRQVLPGLAEASLAARRVEGAGGGNIFRLLWDRTDLLGPAFRFTVLPGVLAAAGLALWRRRRHPQGRSTAAVALLPLGLFAVFAYLHDHRDVRYFFAALALAGVGIGWALEQVPPPARRRLLDLLTFSWVVAALVTQVPRGSAVSVAVGGLALCAAVWFVRGARTFRPAAAWCLLALAVPAAIELGTWAREHERRRMASWPEALALERVSGLAPTAVAYVGGNQPYPFFGRRLQNRVEIIPTHGPASERTFDWHGTAGFPYLGGRFAAWWRNLRELGIAFVVVDRVEADTGDRELRWMAAHPDQFQPLVQTAAYEIWKVAPGSE